MNIIKLAAVLFTLFFISCSAASQPGKPASVDPAKIEKNKQIALLNEVGETVRDAQSIEKLGRNMDSYRLAADAASKQTCSNVMTDNQQDLAKLEARIKNLPGNFKDQLNAVIPDLNECISCSKKAMPSCVKARASVNQIIKEIYP